MKRTALFLALCLWLPLALSAQVKTEEIPYIEVTGMAEKEIIPDEIYISIILRERYEGKTKITVAEQEQKLRQALSGLGIDAASLSLADANADYVRVGWRKKDVITKKDYLLKLSDAGALGRVFEKLDELQILDAFVARVDHSKMDSLRKAVRIQAAQAAKDKAEYLLQAVGEKCGKAMIIREMEIYPYQHMQPNVTNVPAGAVITGEYYKAKEEDAQHDITFRKIKIQSSVYAKFSIQ